MIHGRKIILYVMDLFYGATRYPCGWFKPSVVKGRFHDDEIGYSQRLFFNELLNLGFRRTHWQLVFPNQVAGLVKKILLTLEGMNEYHVRFYSDGVIDCELEVDRFNGLHWAGPRKHEVELLEGLLENEMPNLSLLEGQEIRKLFGVRDYSSECTRK